VCRPIAVEQRWGVESGQLAIGILEGVCRKGRVESSERVSQTALEDHVAKAGVTPLGVQLVDGQIRAVLDRVA
jgi:hypothetical protein